MNNKGSIASVIGWAFLLIIMAPIAYVFGVAFVKATIPAVQKEPLILLVFAVFAAPVIGGFLVGRSGRKEYLRRRKQNEDQANDIAVMRSELAQLRRQAER